MAARICKKYNITLHHTTMNKYLNTVLSKPLRQRLRVTINEASKIKRKKFCEEIKRLGIKGKEIMFTDEKYFTIDSNPNKQTNVIRMDKATRERYDKGEDVLKGKLDCDKHKFPTKIMVLAGVSSLGPTRPIFCIGTVNSFAYAQGLRFLRDDILSPRLMGSNTQSCYFQQDNAPCHNSADTLIKIGEYMPRILPKWPANSPDLSPIENLWGIVQDYVSLRKPEDITGLVKAIIHVWERIPKDLCKALCRSFDKRLEAVILNNGGRIKNTIGFIGKKRAKTYSWKNKSNTFGISCIYNDETLTLMRFKEWTKANKELMKEIRKARETILNELIEDAIRDPKAEILRIKKEIKRLNDFIASNSKKDVGYLEEGRKKNIDIWKQSKGQFSAEVKNIEEEIRGIRGRTLNDYRNPGFDFLQWDMVHNAGKIADLQAKRALYGKRDLHQMFEEVDKLALLAQNIDQTSKGGNLDFPETIADLTTSAWNDITLADLNTFNRVRL